jgi:hypothetical protein
LGADEKKQLIQDVPLVAAWVGEIFRKIAEET